MVNLVEIKRCVDNDVRKLFTVFRRQPATFLSEADVRCYLYNLLVNDHILRTFQPAVKDWDYKTVLVHAEAGTMRPKQRRFDIVIAKPTAKLDIDDWDGYVGIEIKVNRTFVPSRSDDLIRDIHKAHDFDVGYVLWLNWRYRMNEELREQCDDLAKKYGNVTFWYINMFTKPIKTNVPRV